MFGRSSFGVSQPNSFGFGSGASTSFGQPNQLFGSASSSFGSGSSGFGSASQPIFGNAQPNTAPLFGSSATPSFGQSNQSSGFGSSLFGASQQPSSSNGIFGSGAGTSFGQQNKTTGFGFPSSSAGGLFGQTPQTQPNGGTMFQGPSSSALFGNSTTFGSGQAQAGTVAKFVPVTGTDSQQKSGVVQSINTKHYCITCMKEYENKSLEELRWEDYQSNRKGQQQPGFGGQSQPFGIASTNSNLFGQTENKAVFGQASTAFGQPTFGISAQTTASNMFGKSSSAFGNTSTTNSFAFGGTPTTGIFGTNTGPKPFAATSNQPLFGAPQQQQNNFGTNIFGQPNTSANANLFAKPTQQGFNMGQSTFQFGTQPQNTSVFQNQKPNTGFNIFGQTNTTNSGFGQPQQQSTFAPFNNFGKSNQSTFGQMVGPPFMGIQNQSTLYNNNTKSMFTPSTNLFGNNYQQSTGFNLQSQQGQLQPMSNMQGNEGQLQEGRPFLQAGDPYGYNPHLAGLSPPKHQCTTYATNPKELQKYLEAPQPIAVVTPTTKKIKVFPPAVKKVNLFDDAVDTKTFEINLTLKTSAKRLVIKKDNLTREPSDTSLASTAELRSADSIMSTTTVGPPALSPVRLRKPLIDEYSSSGITFSESRTTLLSENSDKSISTCSSTTDLLLLHGGVTGSGDSNKTGKSTEPEIDMCGIVLARPEYYTVPSLDKLIEHKLGDGQCLIKGFTIGRVGYGNVCFPELVNVANLNLDELVHFRYRELTIYPDDSQKPPVGQGLNRRAQVTLDRVYPKGKTDRKLITDVETLTAINFAETLRELCERHGTNFLDYRPDTGSWVFMVEHFSKYKYTDSEEDEDSEDLDAQTKQKIDALEMQIRRAARTMTVHFQSGDLAPRGDNVEGAIQDLMNDDDDILTAHSPMQTESVISEASEILDSDIEFSRSQITSDSLHQVKTRRDLYHTRGTKLFLMKATLFDEEYYNPGSIENYNIETIGRHGRLLKDYVRPTPMPARKVIYERERRKSRYFILRNKACALPLNKSIYNCRNYMDMALFKSRSFKVGWGKGLTLTTGWNGFYDSTAPLGRNRLRVMDVSKLMGDDPLLESLPGHLRIVLETSKVELVDGVPFAIFKNSEIALERHQLLARHTHLKDPKRRNMRYYKEIWDLIVALFSEISCDITRREELSNWFRKVLSKEVDDILKKHADSRGLFHQIFAHLTGNQLYEAAELAIRNEIPNLALLISQVNLSATTKPMLQYQMGQWKSSLTLDLIPVPIQKIYMLLSGLLIYEYDSRNLKKTVNVCDSMNWRQCIAIILWYMTSSSDPISTSLYIYKEVCNKHYICPRPTPEHLKEPTNFFDIQYYLMLLYSDGAMSLENMLHPLTHSNYAADYRLSWLLLQTMTALGVGILTEEKKVAVCTSFSIQLESLRLYNWAIFPLLFIQDPIVRKNQIMKTLHHHLDSIPSDITESDIVNAFHIPSQWIHEAKSYRTRLTHWQNYQHLTYTGLWFEAHEIVIDQLIPDLIINEEFDIIEDILKNLARGQRKIAGWNGQGGLLLNYLKIVRQCSNPNMTKSEALKTHSALLRVVNKLPFYPMHSPKQIAAVSEMSKRCFLFAKHLIQIIKPTYHGMIAATISELDRLVMPSDYVFQYLQCTVIDT